MSLVRKLVYFQRNVLRAMSEKRKHPEYPNQLRIDFDKMNMTPEEEEAPAGP